MRESSFEGARENPETVKNFNDHIWVKVTPDGERVREEYYKRLNLEVPALERDTEGFTKMSMWEVAHLFGSEMYIGNNRLPIEMTYRTEDPQK